MMTKTHIAVICAAIFFYSIHVVIDAVIEIRKAIVDWKWFTEELLDILNDAGMSAQKVVRNFSVKLRRTD